MCQLHTHTHTHTHNTHTHTHTIYPPTHPLTHATNNLPTKLAAVHTGQQYLLRVCVCVCVYTHTHTHTHPHCTMHALYTADVCVCVYTLGGWVGGWVADTEVTEHPHSKKLKPCFKKKKSFSPPAGTEVTDHPHSERQRPSWGLI